MGNYDNVRSLPIPKKTSVVGSTYVQIALQISKVVPVSKYFSVFSTFHI
jgi:hypothetical protein